MKILIEEYRYNASIVRKYLHDIDELDVVEGLISVSYVGYYYNNSHDVNDCVFILPKVLIDGNNKVFGKYTPEEIIDLDKSDKLTIEERNFIYEFAVWIYRAIAVFKNSQKDTSIVRHKQVVKVGKGKKRLSNTYLDILLSLIQFNKENQDFFMLILKNIHSGFNKINWSRTISRSSVVVQNNEPIYINPVNKKRQINFDEELLVIYFSILNYISDKFGFTISINCNYDLIKGKRFEHYLEKFGVVRLHQIKYKYFSDKALQLWELCYAFFEQSHQVKVNSSLNEYLLVKNFNIVFEAIIDELVGDKQLPDRLNKKQEDGKIVDHLFMWDSLTTADASKKVYYIGDSKYYKIGNEVGKESVAKQYTYARNAIQWNLNLFLDSEEQPNKDDYKLRDEVTEGYNIIPNFFISAKMDEKLSYVDTIDRTDRKKNQHFQRHFNNRLFDRDTLLITHYDVNFLFVVSLYARNNASQKQTWKTKVRNLFRKEIQQILADKYDFYAMTAKQGIDGQQFLSENFKDVIGKVYTPFADNQVYSLALDKDKQFAQENEKIYNLLDSHFHIVKCDIGQDPTTLLNGKRASSISLPNTARNGVLMVMMESYASKSIKFLENGKLAVGIKWTKDSMEIVENLKSIGYVLFHHRNDNEQHLFAIKGTCSVKDKSEIEEDRYKSVTTTEMYVVVDLDTTSELDSTNIHSSQKEYTPKTRYDAQYAMLEDLKKNNNDYS